MNAPSDTKGKDMDNGEKESADPGNAPFELPPGSSRLKTAIYYITLEMTKRPVFICTAMFSFILFIVVVTFATGLGALSEASSYDWIIGMCILLAFIVHNSGTYRNFNFLYVASTTESKNSDAVEDAMSRVDLLTASGTRMAPYDFPMFFLFNSKNGNDLYNPIDIQRMCNIESIFATNPEYQDFCMLDSNGDCILPTSSVSVFFYGFTNVSEWNCTLLSDSVVDAKKNIFYSVMDTPDGQAQYGLFLDSEADTRGYSIRCNSVWTLGAPLEGYDSATEDTAAQFKKYRMFLTALNGEVGGVEEDLFEEFNIDSNADNFLPYYPSPYMSKASTNNVQVLWFNMMLNQNETERLVGSDLTFAVFSILFVAFWIRVHTGSSFIALFGILMIFLSLPFGLFIYSAVFQIPYYSELHSLVLFIVLGVGADDVFVLVDSWKMTKPHHPGDITNGKNRNIAHRRLNECYRVSIKISCLYC